ncbi:MAG: carbon starvation protein A [Bacteroidales bacterium]|nr:carbon starvation protein A [Bacteroidales bacterium]
MLSFTLSLIALIVGYIFYGRLVERIMQPDAQRPTPALAHPDGVDYIPMPAWKVYMVQFLNIAGTGPIFGAIMGAKFGPAAYLWIVLGCIFAGAVHDYMVGMLSVRLGGAGLPEIVGRFLGHKARTAVMVFSVLLLIMVGAVFVYSPALILGHLCGSTLLWTLVIFAYYVLATMLPIDKIIGKIYPLFAFSLLFMAVALMVCLFVEMPQLPELWDGLGNKGAATDASFTDSLFPCLFITIACGAISGFHSTQSPLMARCIENERLGRPIFYGAMITEGMVAMVWATVAMYFFYGEPAPGYELIAGAGNNGFHTAAPAVVTLICNHWLGIVGGILAMLGVVACPITSGDTAFRSARLIVADFLHMDQQPITKRLAVSLPLFACAIGMLVWQMDNNDGFNVVWQYFGWANQSLTVVTLWAITVYLVQSGRLYLVALIPALFMTAVCTTYLFASPTALGLPAAVGNSLGLACTLLALGWFLRWKKKYHASPTLNHD